MTNRVRPTLTRLEDRCNPVNATLVSEINSVVSSLGSSVDEITVIAGVAYFNASDAVHGSELWKSDGTLAGTSMVKDINPGELGSNPRNLTNVNGVLYFAAVGPEGLELWKSDGTAAGTVLVKDIAPGSSVDEYDAGPFSSNPDKLTNFGGVLYFTADDGLNGRELWKSDGTAAGTVLVKDISTGTYTYAGKTYPHSSSPESLTVAGGTLFFSATTTTHGQELWKSDGTAGGTTIVRDIAPSSSGGYPQSSSPASLFALGSTVYFSASNGLDGVELWKSDGSSAGTQMVLDINSGTGSSLPASFAAIGSTLYFSATTATDGRELWRTNGTAGGTSIVTNIFSGVGSSSPNGTIAVGSTLYFAANNGTVGTELWKSDGTSGGTSLVLDVRSGSSSSVPSQLTAVGSTVYFVAHDGTNGSELWKSGGTSATTSIVKNIASGNTSSSPSSLASFGGSLLFAASGPEGTELWISNGTSAGTVVVKDINFATNSSAPDNFVVMGGFAYFTANDGVNGFELWRTDGTTAGTSLVKDVRPGGGSSSPADLTVYNGALYFTADNGTVGRELWRSDGTGTGTTLVRDIQPGASDSEIKSLIVFDNFLYFSARTSANGKEMWKSDGTMVGTVVVDLVTGSGSSGADNLGVGHDAIYLTRNDARGAELWKSNGTKSGTVFVKDLYTGGSTYYDPAIGSYFIPNESHPRDFFQVDGQTFFVADTGVGRELWRTNGTAVGTVLVRDINPGSDSDPYFGVSPRGSNPGFLANLNGTLYFAADNVNFGNELWKSNGTLAGTVLVQDLVPLRDPVYGAYGSYPESLQVINGQLYFVAIREGQGRSIWRTDGTSGLAPISVSVPGINAKVVKLHQVVGDKLLLTLETNIGQELWSVGLRPTISSDSSNFVVPEGGLLTATGTYDDFEGASQVSLSANVGTVSVDPANGTWTWRPVGNGLDGPQGMVAVTITATDGDGRTANTNFNYTVADVAPTSNLAGESTAIVNDEVTITVGDVHDPGLDTISSFVVNWGDGNTTPGTGDPAGQSFVHSYASSGSFTVRLQVINEDGTFNNVASQPVEVLRATLDTVTPNGGMLVGTVLTNSAAGANQAILSGKADSVGLTIHVFDGDLEIGTTTSVAGPNGPEWTYDLGAVTDGPHRYRVRGGAALAFSPAIDLLAVAPTRFIANTLTTEDLPARPFSVRAMLSASYVDGNDTSAKKSPRGAAITGVHGAGTWQYMKAGKWVDVGSVSDQNALLLADTNTLRYVPALNESAAGAITYRAWDQSIGNTFDRIDVTIGGATGGTGAISASQDTAFVDIAPVNDRPTLDGSGTIVVAGGGASIASLLQGRMTDVDSASIGVAVTSSTGKGTWQYDAGLGWTDLGVVSALKALPLLPTTLVKFVPDPTFVGAATLSVKAWDQSQLPDATGYLRGTTSSSFSSNTEVLFSASQLDPPVVTGTPANFPDIAERAVPGTGATITQIVTPLVWNDPDVVAPAKPTRGVAVTGSLVVGGQWQFQLAGRWVNIEGVSPSNALLLSSVTRVRFVPAAGVTGTATLQFLPWDQSIGVNGERIDAFGPGSVSVGSVTQTTSVNVVPVNDVPVLDTRNTPRLPDISGPVGTSSTTVASLLGSAVTDLDGPAAGISISAVTAPNGTWEYFDGSQFVPFPVVSTRSPLRLDASVQVRFNATANGVARFTYQAWDSLATGREVEQAYVSTGSVRPVFSLTSPVSLATIKEDTITPPAIRPTTLLAGVVASRRGIAIVGVTGDGVWQYLSGRTWRAIEALSDESALILRDTDSVRFVPSKNWHGSATIRVRAWDQTVGVAGDRLDTTSSTSVSADFRVGTVVVTAINDRPTMDITGTPFVAGTGIGAPTGWMDVADLMGGTSMSDVDGPANFGIAVTGISAGGYWEVSSGGTIERLKASAASARLLQATTRVRFVPTANFVGKVSLTFRAWDGTSPAKGNFVNPSTFLGVSLESETAFLNVGNLAPVI